METNDSTSQPNQPDPRKFKKEVIIGLILLAIIAVVLVFVVPRKAKNPAQNQNQAQQSSYDVAKPLVIDVSKLKFNYTEANTPLSQVTNFAAVMTKYGLQLTAAQKKYLDQNKFLL